MEAHQLIRVLLGLTARSHQIRLLSLLSVAAELSQVRSLGLNIGNKVIIRDFNQSEMNIPNGF